MRNRLKKSLAVVNPDRQPTFEEVADVVQMGVRCDLSVCVLCWSDALRERWQREFDENSRLTLDVLDSDQTTMTEWKNLFSNHAYDLTVLHGIHSAYENDQLSNGYARALFEAIPQGTVVWA